MEAQKQTKDKVPKDLLLEPIVISEKLRAQAKGLGIDVGRIVDTANLLRQRVLGIEGAIITIAKGLDERDQKLQPLVNLANEIEQRKKAMPQGQPQQGVPQQGGGLSLGGIIGDLKAAGVIGGSEPDPMMKMFMQEVFKAGLESMFMGSALMKTYVSKVAPQEFAEAMRAVEEKAKIAAGAT